MKVKWIKLLKNGLIEMAEDNLEEIPCSGGGVFVGNVGYSVRGHVSTPHLEHKHHVFLSYCVISSPNTAKSLLSAYTAPRFTNNRSCR